MKDLEGNKILASVLVAGLLAMVAGKAADILYKPTTDIEKRGYSVEVAEEAPAGAAPKVEEVIDIAALMSAADSLAGKKVYKKCAACHNVEQGAPHKSGPNLHAIINAKVARHGDYTYSDALASKGEVWNYDNLFAFLKKPKKWAPGTKMSFGGLKKPKDVANLVAFLRENGSQGQPLP